ncbi:hypothetical protein F183_A51380 [Bryobacterales bacterium F-183]|nr:hypothetical protein F183_A51380 [Bryobacterales bacterium F-183]
MRRFFALALLSAATMLAGDLTGVWVGTLTHNTPEGPRPSPAYAILKQNGTELTGSGGPTEDEQYTIRKAVMSGDKLTFEVDNDNGPLKFTVTAKGDTIEGDLVQERSDGSTRTAKVALKRKQ